MPAPDTNITPFSKGEKLTADRLNQLRAAAIANTDQLQAGDNPPYLLPQAGFAPLALGTANTYAGITDATIYYPSIIPTNGTIALAESNLGEKATLPSGHDPKDAEVWDLSVLGKRLGHFAGYNKDGLPIFLIDGGGGGDLRVFDITKDGGLDGTRSVTPTLTYTVKTRGGTTVLGTSIPVTDNGGRIVNAKIVTYGTIGTGYMNGSTPVLIWTNERYASNACSL